MVPRISAAMLCRGTSCDLASTCSSSTPQAATPERNSSSGISSVLNRLVSNPYPDTEYVFGP